MGNMGENDPHLITDGMAGMNYIDSNRTNTVILKFEAVKVMRW
jgi:hypothetical protein